MEYYVIERGGVEFYKRFLNNPEISRSRSWPYMIEDCFSSFNNAYRFENVNEAHQIVRENDGEFQGRVLREASGDVVPDGNNYDERW